MTAALTPEDPCPACGSTWTPHRCHLDPTASALAHRRVDTATRATERAVRAGIVAELEMRCHALHHPHPCHWCDPYIRIAGGEA